MYQLEFKYFYPLTEQIPLTLDFTPCEEYEKQKQAEYWKVQNIPLLSAGTGATWANIAPTMFQFKPEPDAVGYWQL